MDKTILFDICAVATLITLLVALIVRKQTKGRNNRLFLLLVVVILISGITDIFGVYYDNLMLRSDYNVVLRYVLNYLYFFFRNVTILVYVVYILSLLGRWQVFTKEPLVKYFTLVPFGVDVIALLQNFRNKNIFYINENYEYVRGDKIFILYIVAFFYFAWGIGILIKNSKLVSRTKWVILLIFLPVNMASVVVQTFLPYVRLEVLAAAMLALALAISIQRPEETMDFTTGAQSYRAFLDDTSKVFKTDNPTSVLLINFTNHEELMSSIGTEMYLALIRRCEQKIEQICKAMNLFAEIYYLDHGTFAVVTEVANYEKLLDVGRVIVAYMQEPMKLSNLEIMVSSRVCILSCPDDIGKEEAFLNFVNTFQNKLPNENHLIELKKISGSRDFKIRNEMDTIIKRGIEKYNFQMYYQPIYSVSRKKFVSAEALIRLIDDDYGFVSPAVFIPASEESGAIHQIGDFVLEDVCRFIGNNDFSSLDLEYVEINLSVAQCIEGNLAEKVFGYMEKYGVTPDQINLEITETSVDYDPATTDRNIKTLSEAGISFSLDDYGTGYSNIARVVSLPLDIVKLDKSLVDEMDSPLMWTVITNTVRMLKRMNKKILVEGVEDERALNKFIDIGCDYIQGFYFSKPLNETDFLKFILRENYGMNL